MRITDDKLIALVRERDEAREQLMHARIAAHERATELEGLRTAVDAVNLIAATVSKRWSTATIEAEAHRLIATRKPGSALAGAALIIAAGQPSPEVQVLTELRDKFGEADITPAMLDREIESRS